MPFPGQPSAYSTVTGGLGKGRMSYSSPTRPNVALALIEPVTALWSSSRTDAVPALASTSSALTLAPEGSSDASSALRRARSRRASHRPGRGGCPGRLRRSRDRASDRSAARRSTAGDRARCRTRSCPGCPWSTDSPMRARLRRSAAGEAPAAATLGRDGQRGAVRIDPNLRAVSQRTVARQDRRAVRIGQVAAGGNDARAERQQAAGERAEKERADDRAERCQRRSCGDDRDADGDQDQRPEPRRLRHEVARDDPAGRQTRPLRRSGRPGH